MMCIIQVGKGPIQKKTRVKNLHVSDFWDINKTDVINGYNKWYEHL